MNDFNIETAKKWKPSREQLLSKIYRYRSLRSRLTQNIMLSQDLFLPSSYIDYLVEKNEGIKKEMRCIHTIFANNGISVSDADRALTAACPS